MAAARSREAIAKGQGTTEAGLYRLAYSCLAMAQHHQGLTDEARQSLAIVEQALGEWAQLTSDAKVGFLPRLDWHQWVSGLVLYREAKLLITGSAPVPDPRLLAIQRRALDAITKGDARTFMVVGREHLQRQEWDAAARSFAMVLDQLPRGFRGFSEEMRMCVEMARSPEVFARLTKQRPQDPRVWHARGRIHASASAWPNAAGDLAKTLELRDEELKRELGNFSLFAQIGRAKLLQELAALHVLAGNEPGYRNVNAKVVAEHKEFERPMAIGELSRALTLRPCDTKQALLAIQMARQAVTAEPETAWYLFALGAAEYRAGNYQDAVTQLKESLRVDSDWFGRGQNYVVLAMACHQLGERDKAADFLTRSRAHLVEMDQANQLYDYGYAESEYMVDWLALKILLAEAEALIAPDETP